MDRLVEKGKSMGAEDALVQAMDMQLEATGEFAYFPANAPVPDLEEDDVNTIAEFTGKEAMRMAFKPQRDAIRESLMKDFDEMRNDNEGEIRFSDDFVFDVDDDELDELTEAFLEDELNDEEESDGSGEETVREEVTAVQ